MPVVASNLSPNSSIEQEVHREVQRVSLLCNFFRKQRNNCSMCRKRESSDENSESSVSPSLVEAFDFVVSHDSGNEDTESDRSSVKPPLRPAHRLGITHYSFSAPHIRNPRMVHAASAPHPMHTACPRAHRLSPCAPPAPVRTACPHAHLLPSIAQLVPVHTACPLSHRLSPCAHQLHPLPVHRALANHLRVPPPSPFLLL